jgi:predicted fused transcriptional regulator/phosphomethylpyrimidine kinase/predicted transcriptional regulator
MYPPCVSVNEYLIPETRKRTAKKLIKKGYTEKEVAKHLHISQGMVSKYLRFEDENYLSNEIDFISNEISSRIIEKYSEKSNTELFCNFCIKIRENGKFCSIHHIENCNLCFYMYNPEKNMEKSKILFDLNITLEKLTNFDLGDVIPEVRINLAYSIENPQSIMDVAAFPGRLTVLNGKIKAIQPPQFGASRHLSKILIEYNKRQKNMRAIINLKFNKKILEWINKKGFKIALMDRNIHNNVESFIETLDESYNFIADPGGFGIEPAIYIFDETPTKIIEKIEVLME